MKKVAFALVACAALAVASSATAGGWTRKIAFAHGYPGDYVNGNFRDGILQNFTASKTYPGHAYVTYEDYNAATGTVDVKFSYTTDGGFTFSTPVTVNDPSTVGDGTGRQDEHVHRRVRAGLQGQWLDRDACRRG